MMAPSLAILKTKRAATKGALTRIKTFVETTDKALVEELECRLSLLEAYFKQLVAIQDQILNAEEATEADKNATGEIEDMYCSIKAKLLSKISSLKKSESSTMDGTIDEGVHNRSIVLMPSSSSLPKFKLPNFFGNCMEYTNFINSFKIAVSQNQNLSNIEKFLHLRSCLSGEAYKTIAALEVTESNYEEALKLLESRYGNKYIIFQTHISKLFEIPAASKGTATQLRSVVDGINVHLQALRSLGSTDNILNSIILHVAKKKIDCSTTNKWEESLTYESLPTWKEFASFLNTRCQCLHSQESTRKPESATAIQRNSRLKSSVLVASKQNCAKCNNSEHTIHKCPAFMSMTVMDRFNHIKKLGLCVNCLNKGHSVKNCHSSRCRICSSPHHSLLHRFASQSLTSCAQNQSFSDTAVQAESSISGPHSNTALHSSLIANTDQVILATAVIYVKDRSGRLVPTRVLLDSASQLNFISESLVQRLQLNRNRIEVEINGIGNLTSRVKSSTNITVKSRLNDFNAQIEALVLNNITSAQPENRIDIHDWHIPPNIQLADPKFHIPQKIDILLGAEIFYQLLSVGQIKLGNQLPALQKTVFGWIVAGRFKTSGAHKAVYNLFVEQSEKEPSVEVNLQNQVEKFWKMEEVENVESYWTPEQRQCEQHFHRTTTRADDGRFVVKLPFKRHATELGYSYNAAKRSLLRLESKLAKNEDLNRQYLNFMQEYEQLQHMKVSSIKNDEVKYFIPHRCVLRPDSSSTKLRVVFNASYPTSTNISLNDTLMVGPTIQDDLFAILIRFRCRKYAVTADISKMYRQISVALEDQRYLGILWRNGPHEPVKTYLLSTVTYGTACAPYQATRCLAALADKYDFDLPIGAKVIKTDFYVDDMISGADSLEELIQLKENVQTILSSAKFELRKWSSNNKEFLQTIPLDHRETTLRINNADIIKTLGLIWDPSADNFQFTWHAVNSHTKTSKRTILAIASSLFDPLGLISPIVVVAKLLLQRLWCLKLTWDESLPMDIQSEWHAYQNQLQNVSKIQVPRHIYRDAYKRCEIHGFADASMKAYGCCIYLRSITAMGKVSVHLVSSKSRIAPLKTQSLPRLELCAALLLSKLLARIQPLLKSIERTVLWTDSEISLHWIKNEPSCWNIFIANRVSQIQQLTEPSSWRHVDSKSNPADLVSRGCTVDVLITSIWFTGPNFLLKSEANWPNNSKFIQLVDVPEKRSRKSVLKVEHVAVQSDMIASNTFANDYTKLCRIYGYVLRYCKNIVVRLKQKGIVINYNAFPPFEVSTEITPSELKEAERRIVFIIQRNCFSDEIKALGHNKAISSDSRLKSLCPFLDEGSPPLLRVGGRLRESNLPFDAKFPILLPKNHPFPLAILRHLHRKLLHAGSQALVAACRQQYWIIDAKAAANCVIKHCIHCFHYRPKTFQQIMGNLPPQRIEYSSPFTNTGVDFCGPIWISSRIRGRPLQKAYIALFICFASKAVHLEVVSDLSAEAFILALKRFVARRGKCSNIFCDNATNFVGARTKLAELYYALFNEQGKRKILQTCTEDMMTFRFIPPRSPHFGGLWESTIKSAKHHLYRIMHNTSLNFEELSTLVAQVEAILNSRPISAMSADPNDEQVLSPGHFLIGRPLNAIPEPDATEEKLPSLTRWKLVCALQQHFWRRWVREYIPHLQQRYKWNSISTDVQVGTLVLVADDQQPPQKWIMGRIVDTYPGPDGLTRVVDVRTKQGILRRSIHKLAPLPLANH